MPDPSAFKQAFQLIAGHKLGSAKIENVHCGHECLKRFRHYTFPLELQVTAAGADSALRALKAMRKRIVLSAYGSPYECKLKNPHLVRGGENESATITALGDAVRVKKSRRAEVVSDHSTEKQRAALKKRDYEVVKAHFNTGRCDTCGEAIETGVWIAKAPKWQGKRGHWSHATCI